MTRRVLDVGNCRYDHAAICRMIESNFDATVVQAHGEQDALAALREGPCDLVLINRVLDRDRTDGIGLIQTIKADRQLAHVPVMLVTNHEEHQQAAVAAGRSPALANRPCPIPARSTSSREYSVTAAAIQPSPDTAAERSAAYSFCTK